ncbi:LysR family transcriptional regulator [Nonomuraea fastidiosa]|jgi:DNA-binding transcriptional LysR family regulator|uniref:LysR family transcriptional regulator n=1 Tax=Nonomuraea TaxID=83681 RepID=UPI0032461CC4
MDVQLRHLRAFVAVVDAGTFTDAAILLGCSQAAVSRSVAALESTLGTRLLERSNNSVKLTQSGARLVTRARRVLDEVARLERIAQEAYSELRLGYAFGALGKHTRHLMKAWAAAYPWLPLVFVHSNTATAGLAEGVADVSVLRRPLVDDRFEVALVGCEARYAAMDTDHPLARRRSVRLDQLARYTVALDPRTGTATPELWPPDARPAIRTVQGVDEWLTVIACGQAVGVTAESTANQNPRPGVAYRHVTDAPHVQVLLAWWKDDPPPYLAALLAMIRSLYGSVPPGDGLPREPVDRAVAATGRRR